MKKDKSIEKALKKATKMNQGTRVYLTPWEREERRSSHKAMLSFHKSRKKRKRKNR